MDPELLQSIADANGLPVQHFDGYSVVDHPTEGPMRVEHPPRARVPAAPAARVPRRPPTRTVDLGPDPVATVHASPELAATIRQMDDARAQVAAYQAQHAGARAVDQREATQRQIADDAARELDAMEEAQGYSASDPDRYGIVTRTYADGRRRERYGPDTAFRAQEADLARAQREVDLAIRRGTPTHAGVLVGPDGSRVVTDDAGNVVQESHPLPPDYSRFRAPMSESQAMRQDARAIQSTTQEPPPPPDYGPTLEQLGAAPGYGEVPDYGPTLEQLGASPDGTRPAPAPTAPVARGVGGGMGRGRAPMAPAVPAMPLPQAAPDSMFSRLAQGSVGPRREADLIDRQMLHDQQVAQAGREDALRQMSAEREMEAQRQRDEADRRQAMAGAQRAYQRAIDRVANARLDPSRWFRDQGAGGTIGAAIAIALGGLGQALGGTDRNLALEEINHAIDRDMEAQQSEIDAGRAAADLAGNALSITRQEYGDRDAAREAARAAMLRQVALQTQAHAADLADDESRLHADELHQQLIGQADEAERAAVTQELQWREQAARIARTEAEAAIAQRRAMGGGGGAPRGERVTTQQLDAFRNIIHTSPNIPRERAAELAGLPPGFVPDLTVSATTEPALAALDAELSHLESLIPGDGGDIPGVGRLDSYAPDLLTSDAGLEVRASAQQVLELLGRLHSGGAISDDEAMRFMAIIGNSAGQSDDALRRGVATIRREVSARLRGGADQTSGPDRDLASLGDGVRWIDEGSE